MKWTWIARKDFADAIRSRAVYGLTVAIIFFLSLFPFQLWRRTEGLEPEVALGAWMGSTSMVIPIIAVIFGYRAIVDERETGSIYTMLSLPVSRRDLLIGKVVGRAGVILIAVIVAYLVGGLLVALMYGGLPVGRLLAHILWAGVIGVTFTTFAVGVSASVKTRGRALAVVTGLILFMWVFETELNLANEVHILLHGDVPTNTAAQPAWYVLVDRLHPWEAFDVIGHHVIELGGRTVLRNGEFILQEMTPASDFFGTSPPFYVEEWFTIVIILAWALIPLFIGFVRLRNTEF